MIKIKIVLYMLSC